MTFVPVVASRRGSSGDWGWQTVAAGLCGLLRCFSVFVAARLGCYLVFRCLSISPFRVVYCGALDLRSNLLKHAHRIISAVETDANVSTSQFNIGSLGAQQPWQTLCARVSIRL